MTGDWTWVDELINKKPPEIEMELPEDLLIYFDKLNPTFGELMDRLNLELEF